MGIVNFWKGLEKRKKIGAVSVVSLMIFSIGYIGIGFVIASQAIAVNPGCGIWSENNPTNWSTYDDWESFEPWPDSEERVSIRQNFNASDFQMDNYREVVFHPRGDESIDLSGWYVEVENSTSVVILTHGMPMNGKCKPEMLLMQSYLWAGGISSLSFDLRNYGNSDVVGDYFAVGQIEYKDILGAYDWLILNEEYVPGKVGMTAFSAGGGAAIAFADEDGIGALWLDSAVLDFPLVVENELGRLGYPTIFAGPAITVGGWLAGVDLDERSPLEAAEKAGNRPVFLTHGLEDARVSLEHSERFRDSMIDNGGNVTTWFVEDRAHVDAIWGESTEYQMHLAQFFSVLS